MPLLPAIFAVLGLCLLALQLIGKPYVRRASAAACILAALYIAFDRDLNPIARALLTLLALVAFMHSVRIAQTPASDWTLRRRVWSVFVTFDVRRARPAQFQWDAIMATKLVVFPALMVFCVWLPLRLSAALTPPVAWVWQQVGAAAFTYFVMDVVAQALRFVHLIFGLEVGPLQRDPIFSRSLAEFWGERWNLPVSQWLNDFCFRPVARRQHATLGVLAAFAASAALHFWLFFAAANLRCGLLAAAFFLVQFPGVALERRMRIKLWQSVAARAWTLGYLMLTAPLLTDSLVVGVELIRAHR